MGCDRYVSPYDDPARWALITENRCCLPRGHLGDHETWSVLRAKLVRGAETEISRIGGGLSLSRDECAALVSLGEVSRAVEAERDELGAELERFSWDSESGRWTHE